MNKSIFVRFNWGFLVKYVMYYKIMDYFVEVDIYINFYIFIMLLKGLKGLLYLRLWKI